MGSACGEGGNVSKRLKENFFLINPVSISKEIGIPDQLKRALAVEQEAMREAKAKVAAAQGERDAVRALKEAADIMETNPIALQLRYLQTLNTICNDNTRSYVFPFPVDIVKRMMK